MMRNLVILARTLSALLVVGCGAGSDKTPEADLTPKAALPLLHSAASIPESLLNEVTSAGASISPRTEGDQAKGTFRFRRERMVEGLAEFSAERTGESWQIVEFRICFQWEDGHAWEVEIADYHSSGCGSAAAEEASADASRRDAA